MLRTNSCYIILYHMVPYIPHIYTLFKIVLKCASHNRVLQSSSANSGESRAPFLRLQVQVQVGVIMHYHIKHYTYFVTQYARWNLTHWTRQKKWQARKNVSILAVYAGTSLQARSDGPRECCSVWEKERRDRHIERQDWRKITPHIAKNLQSYAE